MISKFNNIVTNPHKKELLKGTAETMIIKILGMIIGYIFIMILSRNYGAETIGIYQIALQFMGVMTTIAIFGFNQSIIRFTAELVSKNYISELKYLLKKFSLISFCFSVILAILVYIFSENLAENFLKDKNLALIFQMLSFVLPFFTLNILYVEFIRGLKKIKTSEFLRLFSIKFLNLIGFLIALWFVEFNNYIPIITYEIALMLSFSLAFYFAYTYMKEKEVFNTIEEPKKDRKYISTSFTMFQSTLLMIASNQGLVFILAYYTTPAEVGIYNVAFQIAALSIFLFSAITTITAPKYSELYYNDKENFKKTVRFSSKLVFWTTGSLSIMTIILSSWLMSIFGEEFVSGSTILIILSIGNFINAFTGSSGVLLDMVGREHIRRNIHILNTSITLSLSFILIPLFGSIGLAYILLINMIIGNFIGVYYVHKNLDVNMIYLPFITKG